VEKFISTLLEELANLIEKFRIVLGGCRPAFGRDFIAPSCMHHDWNNVDHARRSQRG
jgi:hypothetical protein